jgi:hypothetical protein
MHSSIGSASSAVSQKIHFHVQWSQNQPSIEAAMLSDSSRFSA